MTQILDPDEVAGYIAGREQLRALVNTDALTVREVGDGNLNQVFVCSDASGRRLVLKQALPYVRLVGPDWPMTEDRARREARTLATHHELSPDTVCRLIDYDEERHVLALEDLSDHEVLRTRLNNGGPLDAAADRLSSYVADYGFGTSYFALGEETFRLQAAESLNTELCALTEDLIFTEPFLGAERNQVSEAVQPLHAELMADEDFVAAAMTMKRRFLTRQESLLHGDLHSGSVFVRGEADALSVKAFDSEFAFHGPLGFDLGLLWANLVMAAARARALGETDRAATLLKSVQQSWHTFEARLHELWPQRRTPEKHPDVCLELWLADILDDALGFAGCEMTRRVVGLAKVSDIESLEPRLHTPAATAVLRVARELLVHRSGLAWDGVDNVVRRLAAPQVGS